MAGVERSARLSSLVVAAAAAAAATGLPRPAAALPTGGVFSGPARPSGSSGYYNPAALADLPGGVVALVETGLITGDASYLREGVSPFDGAAFEPVSFSLLAPTFDFSLVIPTPWEALSWGVVGFAASAASSDWPEDGPQAQHGTSGLFLSYALNTGPILKGERWGISVMAGPVFTQAGLRYGIDFGTYANDLAGAPLFAQEDPALLGYVDADTSGWSLAASISGWAEPIDGLRFGAGFLWLESPSLDGGLTVEPPTLFTETFPNSRFRIDSDLGLQYKLPWILSLESELELGKLSIAVLFQYQNKSVRDFTAFALTETDPDILDAIVISVSNARDDWLLGARISYRFTSSLEVGARFDVDPIAVPEQTIHPVNLDFTTYEMGLGAQWHITDNIMVAGTYMYLLVPDLEVTESIFDPTAPGDSGFARPSANGIYSISAMKFLLSFRARFGA